jgi:adenylate cyclase, class 2
MQEIETRILDVDVDFIKSRLAEINAVKVKDENQINSIYDFPDRRLLNAKGYARVREVEDRLSSQSRCYITTKRLLSQDKYKIMDENEVEVDDAAAAGNIFKALGLELVQSIKKHRESYKYNNTLVEIDINDEKFCPFPYIEIEGCDEKELIEVVELLGYSMSDTTSKTIFEILGERGLVKGL